MEEQNKTGKSEATERELSNCRTPNGKIFRMADGTQRAQFSLIPHSFQDKDGIWQDIDDTLEARDKENEEDFAGFENKSNSFRVKLAQNLNSGRLLRLKKGKYELEWRLADKPKTPAGKVASKRAKMCAARHASCGGGEITYTDFAAHTDLKYTVANDEVKENIIVKERGERYEYAFTVTAKNLELMLDEGGRNLFAKDGDEEVFFFPAPYMFDAAGAVSQDVFYTLEKSEDGYRLSVKAEADWINAEERVFPVTIDPTVSSSGYGSNTVSTNCCAPSKGNIVGYSGGNYYRMQFKISMDIPATTTKATLTFKADTAITIYVGKLRSSYSSGKCLASYTDSITCSRSGSGSNYTYTADITKYVKAWLSGEINYGMVLMSTESGSLKSNAYISNLSMSCDYQSVSSLNQYKPMFDEKKTVYGSESLKTECGFGGTSAVDLYTGRHVYTVPLFLNKKSVQIALVYNSDYKDEVQFGTCLGYGWRLNVLGCLSDTLPTSQQSSSEVARTQRKYMAFVDGAGRQHEFYQRQYGDCYGTDEFDGVKTRKYRRVVTSASSATYMTDEQYVATATGGGSTQLRLGTQNYTTFNVYGLPYEEGNGETGYSASFTYNGSRKLTKIEPNNGVAVQFGYDSVGRLTTITNGDETVTISYNSAECISSVHHCGQTTSFDYTGHLLNYVKEADGRFLEFTYSANKVTKVSEASVNSSVTASGGDNRRVYGNSWFIDYKNRGLTRVRDNNYVYTDYLFGRDGRLFCVANSDGGSEYEVKQGKVNIAQLLNYQLSGGNVFQSKVIQCSAELDSDKIMGRVFETQQSVSNGTVTSARMQNIFNKGVYVFCCWVKANSTTPTKSADVEEKGVTAHFGVRLCAMSPTNQQVASVYVPCDPKNTDWQFVAVPFDRTGYKPESNTVNHLVAQLDYRNNTGTAYIKNGALYHTDGQCMFMFDNDYSVTVQGEYNVVTLYDYYGRPCKLMLRKNGSSARLGEFAVRSYTGSYEKPDWETDFSGIKTTYTYDGTRRVTQKVVSKNGLQMRETCSYTTAGDRTMTDECGRTYGYKDESWGYLNTWTMPSGDGYRYSYTGQMQYKGVCSTKASAIALNVTYKNGLPVNYKHDSKEIQVSYDGFGRITNIGEMYSKNVTNTKSIVYTDFATNAGGVVGACSGVKMTYGNGFNYAVYYNKYGQPINSYEGSVLKEKYTYNSNQKLTKGIDNYAGKEYNYEYREGRYADAGELISVKEYKNGTQTFYAFRDKITEDGNEVSRMQYQYGSYTDDYSSAQNYLGRVVKETSPLGSVTYAYDALGRLSSRNAYGRTETYGYMANVSNGSYTTPLANKVTYSNGDAYVYEYDANGNIKRITDKNGTEQSSFEYDFNNRMTRENIKGHKTVLYTYDRRGNITEKSVFDYTTITPLNTNYALETIKYTYSNSDKDQLTGYNGATCSYDANGNPTVYRGKNMAWMRGRLLQNYNGATYSYNAEGIRTGKSGVEFVLDGDKVIAEKLGGTVNKRYFYDGTGIAGMEYGGAKYYFRKNLQGDVVGIVNSSGTLLGTYVYDAWGKVLAMGSATIFTLNPFRYRGYYYDNETGFYYLNSRYYDPETGRFINPDTYSYIEPEKLGGLNLYAYCDDNPVNYCDPDGHGPIATFLLGLAIASLTFAIVNIESQLVNDVLNVILTGSWESSWEDYLGAFLGGLAGGAVFYLTKGNLQATFAVMGGVEALSTSLISNASGRTNYSAWQIIGKTAFSVGIGYLAGKFFGGKKVSGITTGKNSYLAIWKTGLTKLNNSTVQKMSFMVMYKGLIAIATMRSMSGLLGGITSSLFEWFQKLLDDFFQC